MRRVVAAALAVAVAVPAAGRAAPHAGEVTIRVHEFFQQSSMSRQVEVSGTVASRQAGETVELLVKECGPYYSAYRLVAATRTAPGGSWRLATNEPSSNAVQFPINAYFRAKWRDHLSEPVLNRVAASAFVHWRPRVRRADVSVFTGLTGQNLRGRYVELQRRLPGTDSWVRVRRARLRVGTQYGVYATTFTVRTRGLTLRVLIPAETGAPCFSTGVSQTWRS